MTCGNDHARHPGIDAGLARLIGAGHRALDRFAATAPGRLRPPAGAEALAVLPGPTQAEPVHAVLERERARLARELHDELGALLAAARLELHALVRQLGPVDASVQARIGAIERTLKSGVDLKVRLVEGLRPSTLALLGLAPALEEMVLAFTERFAGEVDCELDETPGLDDDAALTLYRCAQESLTNIAKHAAGARSVRVVLRATDGEAMLTIEDDGPGFVTRAVRANHHGLAGLHERVEAAGGLLSVVSCPDRGTRLVARVPRRTEGAPRSLPSPEATVLQPSATTP